MPIGAGKYDHLCTMVQIGAEAEVAVVIVINGNQGHGFSVQATNAEKLMNMPALLRRMADDMEGRNPDQMPGEKLAGDGGSEVD